MDKYSSMGKEVLVMTPEGAEHFGDFSTNADATGVAKLLNDAGKPDFIDEALVTLSPSFHGELVSGAVFRIILQDAIKALQNLDRVKKSLFYGRENNLTIEGEAGVSSYPSNFSGLTLRQATDFIHGSLGYATEAGEMLEALLAGLGGTPVDAVNVMEESGDGKWYLAIIARTFGYSWRDDEARVIAKLRKRFPDAFSEYDANNRNLAVERAALEGDAAQRALPANYRDKRMDGERSQDGDAIEAEKMR